MQLHIYVSGRVQGVGYRRFVKRHAEKFGVVGWVRNLPDRRVEAVLSGQKEAIDTLLKICKKGPFLAEISDIQQVEENEQMLANFTIR